MKLSLEGFEHVGLVGAGAIGGAFIQSAGNFGLGDNIRDVGLIALGVLLSATGHGAIRAIGLGVGAAGVSALVRRNVLTSI